MKLPKITINRIKVEKLGIRTYKALTVPKQTEEQKIRTKKNCRKIAEKRFKSGTSKILVMDDQTYYPIDPSDITGSKFYSATNKKSIPEKFKLNLGQNILSNTQFGKLQILWEMFQNLIFLPPP